MVIRLSFIVIFSHSVFIYGHLFVSGCWIQYHIILTLCGSNGIYVIIKLYTNYIYIL